MRTLQSLTRRIHALERKVPRVDRPIPLTLDTVTRCLSAVERLPDYVSQDRREAIRQECDDLWEAFHEGASLHDENDFLNRLPLELLQTLAYESDLDDASISLRG